MDFSSSAQKPTLLRPGRAHSERGIALVITLILLSVTLVMAIAFLAISRREAGSVSTSTDSVTARLAADAALANAQAQIIASVLATANPYSSGLLVSTNFINVNGFTNGIANPLNVNYDYLNPAAGGGPLVSAPQFNQNVANLLFLPRAPVFVPNATNSSAPSDFRFYLDLNRNGQFEANGSVTNVDNGNNIINVNGSPLVNNQVGDPEWVGVLERPDVPHGPNNKFVARYAFVAVPADGSLDLNAIHNQAKSTTAMNFANDGYFRNQGVGSWEINLAAFLADLNTNQWETIAAPYNYRQGRVLPFPNTGFAFEDALTLLSWRYANNYNSLASLQQVLGAPGYAAYASGIIDSYAAGNLMTNTHPPFLNIQIASTPWAGADNTNHYFALPSDLFDTTKIKPNNFVNHLELAGNGNGVPIPSTYDRYTFYRMLAQLGTDSAPAQNQVNLNYANAAASFAFANNASGILVSGVLVTNITYFPNAQTNLAPWQPLQFFTIAADRLLREYSTTWFQSDPTNYLITYYGITPTYEVFANGFGVTNVQYAGQTNLINQIPSFGITNIPVLVNGNFVYTPAVQRVLQLAANMYDATTNKTAAYGENYPSVFRPILYKTVFGSLNNVSIVGYQDVASYFERFGGLTAGFAPLDLPLDVNSLPTGYTPPNPLSVTAPVGNVYGVPWIIGAKKGFPNFNEFSMQDVVKVTRKLQVTRPDTNSLPTITNQMYVVSITNSMGVEFWNSYTNGYTNTLNPMQVVVNDNLSIRMALTNGTVLVADGFQLSRSNIFNPSTSFNVWPPNAFLVPFATNFAILSDSAYSFPFTQFYNVAGNPNPTFQATTPTFAPLPQILLEVTNYLQAFIVENNHVIDYVHFSGPGSSRNLTAEFQNTNTTVVGNGTGSYYTNLVWSTALDKSGLPLGVVEQIGISAGTIGLNTLFWKDPNATVAIERFRHFLNPLYALPAGVADIFSTSLAVQVPYTPTAITYEYNTYQANDPLVHYLKSDLNYFGHEPADPNFVLRTGIHAQDLSAANIPLLPNLGKVNARYQPWGTIPPGGETGVKSAIYDTYPYNLAFKDPLMKQSDNWDFPTNKLPTVGWLGRVHRGTPWQTVYLKASNILRESNQFGNIGTNTWAIWTGDAANTFYAANSAPIQDRLLFDNFSTAVNDNATRGQLSVNQMSANTKDPAAALASWSALLSGVVAVTNSTALPQFKQFQPLTNGWRIIDPVGPAGPADPNSRVGQLVTNINYMRTQFKNTDGLTGVFEHVGDVLSTAQLTEQSPFLNWNNLNQQQNGISDEVYEWLPQQTLSLLRVTGTPQSPMRYVIYSYGQSLKPAPNGVVTGGPNLANGASPFGMVTNYQVVAETATRTVVQMRPVITTNSSGTLNTNYSTKIEQFNVLPPD